jgi:5-methylcytosine-specific restriction endonuclease McrA
MNRGRIRQLCARPKKSAKPPSRKSLTPSQRAAVRRKTGGTCHVCGEKLGTRWQADHVVPHKHGGPATVENCLPVCRPCNRLRWSYPPEVLRLIMRLGIYARIQIRRNSDLGNEILEGVAKRFRENKKRRRTE